MAPISISPGAYLTLHYRVALASEEAIDMAVVDTFGDRPATLQLGMGQLAAPLEAKLIGLKEGDHASFELSAGEAYGPRKPELVRQVSRALLGVNEDTGEAYARGDLVEFNPSGSTTKLNGATFAGVLKDFTDEYALLDFNHPLAGQAIRFEVEIIGVL